MTAKIGSLAMGGMGAAELQSYLDSGSLAKGIIPAVKARLAGLKAKQGSAPAPATPAPAKFDRSALDAAAKEWTDSQNADIDRQKEQGLASGISNMIGSGLAGTTAVGGMTAGVNEAATRAKANVAGESKMRTEGLALQYAGLAQSASEGALNRASSENIASMSASQGVQPQQQPSVPGLDAFGRPMSGSVQQRSLAAAAGGGSSAPMPASPSGGMNQYGGYQQLVKDVFSFWE